MRRILKKPTNTSSKKVNVQYSPIKGNINYSLTHNEELKNQLYHLIEDKKNVSFEIKNNAFKDVSIFICAHCDFTPLVNNKSYKIITDSGITITNNNGLDVFYENNVSEVSKMQKSFGETSRAYWVWKKSNCKSKYIGLCHYRSYFEFLDNIPDLDKIFKEYGVICAIDKNCPEIFNNMPMYENIKKSHDENLFLEVYFSIPKLFPEYTYSEIFEYLNMPLLGVRNMVIMKNEDFSRWCNFFSTVIFNLTSKYKFKEQKDIVNYMINHQSIYNKDYKLKNGDIQNINYQSRLLGFIIERLTTIFIRHNFKKWLQIPFVFKGERINNYGIKKGGIAICAIAKCENKYVREWVEYYKKLGVEQIFIYDNNDEYGEKFEDVLYDYISQGYVVIDKTYRGGKKYVQYEAYNAFFNTYKNFFEWISFLDIDEFIELKEDKTLKEYLGRHIFKDMHQILINWQCYTDSGKIYYDNKPVRERFTERLKDGVLLEGKNSMGILGFCENDTVKMFVHTPFFKNEKNVITFAHRIMEKNIPFKLISCDNEGNIVNQNNMEYVKHSEKLAVINHYITKTAEEYGWKMLRGDVNNSFNRIKTDFFFRCNNYSEEKNNVISNIIKKQKECIIILGERNIESIESILKNIDNKTFDIFINIDERFSTITQDILSLKEKYKIKQIFNIKGGYVDGQMLDCQLKLLENTYNYNKDYNHFIFISDKKEFPKNNESIINILYQNRNSFSWYENTYNEYTKYLENVNKYDDVNVYKGCKYICLSGKHVKHILTKDEYFYKIYDIFKGLNMYTSSYEVNNVWKNICPEECFFITYILNKKEIKNEIISLNIF